MAVRSPQQSLPDHLRALLTPAAYPHSVGTIELVQTHVSWVLLTGSFAYKIKRPVYYAFIDLRSAERRAFFCREELRLNQRFAPELYVDVCEITLYEGAARIGGAGAVIDHAVRMRQFPREDELDRLLAAGRIAEHELESFGRNLADIHIGLPIVSKEEPWGRPGHVRSLILENLEQCAQAGSVFGKSESSRALRSLLAERLEVLAVWLSHRLAAGRTRECHGDLHSSNVVRRDARLVAFDCLEFDPAFRWIDVADEIAFLLADLEVQGHRIHAYAFLSGYLAQSGDYEACRVLDLYKAHRALVRAKVTALTASQDDACDDLSEGRIRYEAYLNGAHTALGSRKPQLLLMAGLSGSGKTSLANRLAPLLEAIHLRSDVERKRLAGLSETVRSRSAIEQGLYEPKARTRVYEHLAQCAEHVLCGGNSVIVDATFDRHVHRALFRDLAARLGVDLRLIYCRAPPGVLRRRVAERFARGTDASEADLTVLRWQEAHAEPVFADEGLSSLDVDTTHAEPSPSISDLVRALRTYAVEMVSAARAN
jgi:aminoglycoside phosphotransferase family enzyme/predicted kinase